MQICSNCHYGYFRFNISFDEFGVCGHCIIQDRDKTWQNSLNGKYEVKLADHIEFLKTNKTTEYDCIIGLSGGMIAVTCYID